MRHAADVGEVHVGAKVVRHLCGVLGLRARDGGDEGERHDAGAVLEADPDARVVVARRIAVVDHDAARPVRERARAARETHGDLGTLRRRTHVVEVEERDVLVRLHHHQPPGSARKQDLRREGDALREASEAAQRSRRDRCLHGRGELDEDDLFRVLDEARLRRDACGRGRGEDRHPAPERIDGEPGVG